MKLIAWTNMHEMEIVSLPNTFSSPYSLGLLYLLGFCLIINIEEKKNKNTISNLAI